MVATMPLRWLRRIGAGWLAAGAVAWPGAQAAPDEAAHGAAHGYSPGHLGNWFSQQHAVGAFSAMETLFPVRVVPAGSDVRPLPPHPSAPDWPFVRRYLDTHPATGLMALKDGRVLFEHYQYARSAAHRFTSFSMAKTVVGMAIGVALAEGRIASIDDPVDRYVPALADSAWKDVTLRQVLNMASGVRFDETYDRSDTDISKLSRPWTRHEGAFVDVLKTFHAHDAAPGQRFKYISADTQVLGLVLAQATGQTVARYVGEKIWAPMGAEEDALWVLDTSGVEASYCCLSARLRDWARLGQLLLERGQRGSRSIIPADWVGAATTVRDADRHLLPGTATRYYGYGYQTWIFPGQLGFALLGIRGQAVFVHPRLKLVMVQTAVWPQSSDPVLAAQRDALWRELVRAAAAL
jgi:CubicO group peptidase (beta-lactamase class C family)